MARKDDRKKEKKRKKEKAKARKDMARNMYPRIVLVEDGEDPGFMSEVHRVAETFDFESDACCDLNERSMYKVYRKLGVEGLRALAASPAAGVLRDSEGMSSDELRIALFAPLLQHLGQWIFERLPEQCRQNPLPFHYFHVDLLGRHLEIGFEFLRRTRSEHGTIYSSPLEPTISLGNLKLKVGFFRHPLEQACKRMPSSLPIQYNDFQLCYEYFRYCVYYEPVTLVDNSIAIRLYFPLENPTARELYLGDIAGRDPSVADSGRWHYVLGYCPLAIVRNFAVAKTFLLPGYRGTPESALFRSVKMPRSERDELEKMMDGLTFERVFDKQDIAPFRFFHQNGIPQVVELERPVLDFYR